MNSERDLTGMGSLAERPGVNTTARQEAQEEVRAFDDDAPMFLAAGTAVDIDLSEVIAADRGSCGDPGDDDDTPDEVLARDEEVGEVDADVGVLDGDVPATSKKTRRRQRRSRPRSKTIALKRLTREELRVGALMFPPVEEPRPTTRAECQSEEGPCPWISCKHHLYLDINPETGSIKLNFPDLEPWELRETCALNVAERGGITLEEVGEIMNLTRERIRQVEVRGLLKLKNGSPSPDELGAWLLNPPADDAK